MNNRNTFCEKTRLKRLKYIWLEWIRPLWICDMPILIKESVGHVWVNIDGSNEFMKSLRKKEEKRDYSLLRSYAEVVKNDL